MTRPEKFCIAPFKNLVVNTSGNLMPCCEYLDNGTTDAEHVIEWWNTGLTKMRDNMLNGVIDDNCRHCLAKENNPEYVSHRKLLNLRYHKDIDTIVTDYQNGIVPTVESVELRASNYCNLKCIMCGEYASSAIQAEYNQHTEKYNSVNVFMGKIKTAKWWDNEAAMSAVAVLFGNVKFIRLAGGEPLLVKKLFEIAREVQVNNTCKVALNTSLYTENQQTLDLLSSINDLDIAVSIEGVGEHNDYIRYGSKWNVVHNNLLRFKNATCSHVLQHTSVFALPGLVEYCNDNNLNLLFGEVFSGSYPGEGVLTINSAHPADVDSFKSWLTTYNGPHKKLLDNWVSKYNYDSELNQKFHNYMSMLDGIRGTNFKETFNPTYDIKL